MSTETKSKMPLVTIILVNNWKGFILFHWIGTLILQNTNSWLGSMFLNSKGEDKIVIKNNSMQKKLLETRMSVSNLKLNSGWHLRSKIHVSIKQSVNILLTNAKRTFLCNYLSSLIDNSIPEFHRARNF